MKKNLTKKLRLDAHTVRTLDDRTLGTLGGALAPRSVRSFCDNYCYSLNGEGCTVPTSIC